MGQFPVGSVVLITFPFSDLSGGKKRPALVLADAGRGDYLLLQITSKSWSDPHAITLVNTDFLEGSLPFTSYVRPGKVFTGNVSIIERTVAFMKEDKMNHIKDVLIFLVKKGSFDPS
jgi:mRNA interferase MazF